MDQLVEFIENVVKLAKEHGAQVVRVRNKKLGDVEIVIDPTPIAVQRLGANPDEQAEIDRFYSSG